MLSYCLRVVVRESLEEMGTMSSRSCTHATLCLLLAAPAVGFAPSPATRSAMLRMHTVANAPIAIHQLVAPARRPSSALMAAAAAAPQPRTWSAVPRLALLLLTSLFSVLLQALPAIAVTTARRTTSSAGLPVGDIVKYGSVIGLFGVAFAFRREEEPILTETPMNQMSEEDQQRASAMASGNEEPQFTATDSAAAPAPQPSIESFDDSSLNSALLARMKSLANERDQPDAAPEDEPPADSTDGWGTGNQAVLEPPKPSGADDDRPLAGVGGGNLLDGPPAVEFPPGFPLVDAEWETEPAQASEDQIAMFNRMMGKAD